MTLFSFKKLNPDWELDLYLSPNCPITIKNWAGIESQDYLSFDGKDYLPLVHDLGINIKDWECPRVDESPAHKSDIFQWQMLANTNGWYFDMDILFVKSFAQFYKQTLDYDTAIAWERPGGRGWAYYSIGFVGSSGNNRFFKNVYNYTQGRKDSGQQYQSYGNEAIHQVLNSNGWSVLEEKFPESNPFCIPMSRVYPYDWQQDSERFEQSLVLSEDCLGIHWYGGARASQEANNKVTHLNAHKFPCTVVNYAKQVWEM